VLPQRAVWTNHRSGRCWTFNEAILKLKSEFDGRANIGRYLLGQQPGKFVQQTEVIARLQANGVAVLPITVVNGVVKKERAYPSYAELKSWIEEG
jgi:hypothetical protein